MEKIDNEIVTPNTVEPIASDLSPWRGIEFRQDLAFPLLTEDMIDRLRAYGGEESIPADVLLYGHGDPQTDMFVVLDGGVDIYLPSAESKPCIYARHRKSHFTGEFNLLSAQRAVVEARTVAESRLLRIARAELRRLMRSEGDIANLIVQAFTWRRVGLVKSTSSGVILRGRAGDPETTLLHRFFVRNIYPHRTVELSEEELLEATDAGIEFPCVSLCNGRRLYRPTIPELADELGITDLPDSKLISDVAVVGAGPAGLAAAVYAASEGLCTIVVEGLAPGGQAGTSSKIENYLGFPTGIGGQQLAIRAQMQALKFGVHFAIAREVITIEQIDGIHKLTLVGGISVCARSVVVASGAQYRKLDVKNYEKYENCGIYYAATAMESILCQDREVIVVGGGNSAGQASLFLSGIARHVHHVVRASSFASTMSQYLISRIENSSRITVYNSSEIVAFDGETCIESVAWVNKKTGERTKKKATAVFVMIGAEPNTGWLFGTVRLNGKGFILTGSTDGFESSPYATSMPGIFAVGDARANSVKRVASAVGEGSVVISDVHRYLANHKNEFSARPGSTLAAMQSADQAARKTNL